MNTKDVFRQATLFALLALLLITPHLNYARDIYVTKDGQDTNDGSESAPYLTLKKASETAQPGDIVYIGEGTYEECLSPQQSGTAGNPIIYQAIDGQKVIISAMQALEGWSSDGGNIYKTQTDWDLGQRNFVMNGDQVLDLARWPNNTDGDRFTLNSLRNEGGSGEDVMVDAYLLHSEIPNWDWSNGGSVMFYGDRPGSGWTTWRAWIKSQSAGRINFDAIKNQSWIISAHPPKDLGDYFLEGIKEALDYDNEWYFDANTKTLYVILPGGAQPEDGAVAMARREKTIDLKGKNYIHVKNLAVFGGSIEIEGQNNQLQGITSLYGSMTRGITPDFNSKVNAINVAWNSSNTLIEKCEVGFGDGSGIWDSGSGTTIKNCYIHDFNMLGSYDAPLMVRGQNNAKVFNNTVTRGGRDALQIISKGSEVAYNDFSYSNLIADDCALLYTIGANLNMDIHHNWFHDASSRGKLYKAAGIYMDNDAGNVRVYRNVVWNVSWTNIQINWDGTDIDIFNNTLLKADKGTMGAWHKPGTEFTNVKVWNNISDQRSSDADGNQPTGDNWEPQSDKQNNLNDNTSFTDYFNNDFTLKSNGRAIDFGREIDGYTDGFVGNAPDAGAYEYGDNWVPGVDWDIYKGVQNNGCYGLPGEACGSNEKPEEPEEPENPDDPLGSNKGAVLFQINPNPFTTDIHVHNLSRKSIKNISLLNSGGRLEQRWEVSNASESLDLKVYSPLPSGLYFLKITTASNSETFKILKK
ncbi:right-handed parallel beta-helix repeat-containing protein [Persicobacter diffluens]|uniref:Sugar hydrolase n=1 Tax=Persicobacter diffluens TaxID=981 RepID=A0AAN5AKV6_9BACT|nr:sugar hydrolase [Persicobacter diffluens]